MHQVPLNSRLISSIAYNADSHTLHVWLRSKRHVIHENVSEAVYVNLLNAESAGFYYTAYIARRESPPSRHTATRTLAKLFAACLISILMIGAFASAVAAPSTPDKAFFRQTR